MLTFSLPKTRMHLSRFVLLGAAALVTTTTNAHAKNEFCQAISEKRVTALFDRWNASLQTGDPKQVVANYAAKSVLLPTMSNKLRLTAAEKEDYFQHFLQGKPVGTIDSRTIEIDCNSVIDAGVYTFRFADGSDIKARYTFTYKWDDGTWSITTHHSSAMPEKN